MLYCGKSVLVYMANITLMLDFSGVRGVCSDAGGGCSGGPRRISATRASRLPLTLMRVRGQLDLAGVAESGRGPSRVRFMVDGTISGRSAVTVDRGFDINICRNSAAVSYTRLLVYYCCWRFSQ